MASIWAAKFASQRERENSQLDSNPGNSRQARTLGRRHMKRGAEGKRGGKEERGRGS